MLLAGGVFPAINISAEAKSRRSCLFPSLIISPHRNADARHRSWSQRRNPNSLPAIAVDSTDREPKRSGHELTLAHRLQLGGFAEDGLSYKEKVIVRSYEVGVNKTVTTQIIVSYLQDVACNHFLSGGYSTDDGFSTTHSMRKLNLILVLSRMHVEVYKHPAWNDVVEIETWFQVEGRIGFRRDWILRDYSTGEVIGRAMGWLLMNQETRRFHKVVDDIRDEIQKYAPKSLRLAFPDENKAWLKKIKKLDDPPQYSNLGLQPRRSDLDMNEHLNNATYIGWILESMPSEIIYNYELHSLTIDYRRECRHDDIIDSLTIHESKEAGSDDRHGNINDDLLQFRHLLRLSSDGSETTRARTIWTKKPEK